MSESCTRTEGQKERCAAVTPLCCVCSETFFLLTQEFFSLHCRGIQFLCLPGHPPSFHPSFLLFEALCFSLLFSGNIGERRNMFFHIVVRSHCFTFECLLCTLTKLSPHSSCVILTFWHWIVSFQVTGLSCHVVFQHLSALEALGLI